MFNILKNATRSKWRFPKRQFSKTKSNATDDGPLIQTKTKAKIAIFATGGIMCYLYNKLNKDPEFRQSATKQAPGLISAISSVAKIDRVKMEDVRPQTVWDDIDERGTGVNYSIPRQIVRVHTKRGKFPVEAGPKDNSKTLRDALIQAGMSVDDEVIDIEINHVNSSTDEVMLNKSNNDNNINEDTVNSVPSIDKDEKQVILSKLNEDLKKLRLQEKEIRESITDFQKIEGGKTKVLMMKARLDEIKQQKMLIKSKLP